MSNVTGNGLPPAGWYADPQAPGRERWWGGTAWGEQVRAEQAAPHPPRNQHHSSRATQTCPKCGSNDVRTLKVIRTHGTSTGTGTTTGWVQGSGSEPGHMATFSTTTTNYTAAARAAAPPAKRYNGVALFVAGIVLGAILGWIGYSLGVGGTVGDPVINLALAVVVGLGIAAIGVVFIPGDLAYNHSQWPKAWERWSRSWQCQRCGAGFVV
jgi:hypothetical protein